MAECTVFADYSVRRDEAEVWVVGVEEVHWFNVLVVTGGFIEPARWGKFEFPCFGVECHNRGESLVEWIVFGD